MGQMDGFAASPRFVREAAMGNGFIEEVTILTRRRQDKRKCDEIWC